MELYVPEIKELSETVDELKRISLSNIEDLIDTVEELKRVILSAEILNQEWYDLKTACELKGVNKNTLYSKPKYQPNFGKADAKLCGKKCWHKETIREWLKQIDEDIPEIFR